MKRFVILLWVMFVLICCSSCADSGCQYELPHKPNGICGEKVYNNSNYCTTHKCNYCEKPITSGSSYCEDHRCKFANCSNGIGLVAYRDGEIYCNTHKSIEDIDEFKEAKDIASTWCNTVAAEAAGTLFSPFKFTDYFYIGTSTYKFGVEEIDFPYRDGYVIVERNSDGELVCKGMEYN